MSAPEPLLATRDALAIALHDLACPDRCEPTVMGEFFAKADALLASGVFRDAREWARDGILRAALAHALEHYSGPDDDTVPVLRGWLARTEDPS